jgi:hypothetical protein
MQQFFSLLSWRLFAAQHVSGVFPPIIRSTLTAVAASGFTFVSWWQSCHVRGIINWKTVVSGWWFIWIKCKTPVPKLTTVAIEAHQCVVCIVELYVTVNNVYILTVAQKCFMENLCYRHAKCHIFLSDSKFGVSGQIFVRVSNNKFHINPPSIGRANIRGRTDVTELTGAPCAYKRTPQTRIGWVKVKFHSFLISTSDWSEWLTWRLARFKREEMFIVYKGVWASQPEWTFWKRAVDLYS